MQITLTMDGNRPRKDLAHDLRAFANVLWEDQPTDSVQPPTTTTEKKTKKAKTAESEESFDLGDTTIEEITEETEPTKTLDDVITAFKAYATKHSREKAGKVLSKFNVKSVRDLKTTQYVEVLKVLGA